ncbi:DnaD domain-containing protein [Ureibacillus manganicus]|uniref:DNA replication protein n=1 Tax=Ureibacillus manganicus DSM 26584 TaxID=1384049 RepID=A0A0A3I458_9BACL|nr:DnaD domain-containing protein [Ureibacillus manganicus]KGR79519.1 DNA replication protein [Ureibacillus manganicus DSM 26584]
MHEQNARFRLWTEQKTVLVPQLFFKHYKELKITDDEAIILLHLISFHAENNDFPTPNDLEQRLHKTNNEIAIQLQRLLQKGFIEISQGVDVSGKIFEKYSIYPLWERILDLLVSKDRVEEKSAKKNEEGELFSIFEQEFGRLLSPMELETISMWLDVDKHTPEIIKAALKEAVIAGKISLRYIDRILFEWKKKNITSLKQVEQHSQQFHTKSTFVSPNTKTNQANQPPKVSFYNWLDERE